MRLNGFCRFGILAGLVGPWMAVGARGDVFNLPSGQTSLSLVTVGDPGNAPDTTGFGAVAYTYQISKYSTTSAQYCAFLNAVATTADPYGLYNGSMNPASGIGSPGIVQTGGPGAYSYSVSSTYANFPMTEVSWGDAARFANWLTNGQPSTGGENSLTTEDGSYALNGAVTSQQLQLITRSISALYVIPTENEWYKSSYYKGGNSINAGYWLYPTQSDDPPSNILSITGTNNANYEAPPVGFVNLPYGLTDVGIFASSIGPFGTYDQGGDVYQLTETVLNGGHAMRGGSYSGPYTDLQSDSVAVGSDPTGEALTGFRIAEVPEPCSIAVIAFGASAALARRRR